MRIPERFLALAAAFAFTAAACGGGGGTPSEPDDSDGGASVSVSINVPRLLTLPQGGSVSGTFNADTEGSVTWELRPINYHEELSWQEVGSGLSYEHQFTNMGTFEVRGTARSGSASDQDLDTTAVLPDIEADRPIAFLGNDDPGGGGTRSLMVVDPSDLEDVRTVVEAGDLSTSDAQMSWSPDGTRIAVTARIDQQFDLGVYVVDAETGESTLVTEERSGFQWQPDWHPDGGWIAYVDDNRFGDEDEIGLVRPDGSDDHWAAGATRDSFFTGFNPAWYPDGDLALGDVALEDGYAGVAVFSGLPGAQGDAVDREPLHSREQVEDAFSDEVSDLSNLRLGARAVALTPDGSRIAYSAGIVLSGANFGPAVLANGDGSGTLQVLDQPARDLTWSPDGRYLVFVRNIGDDFHVMMLDVQDPARRVVDLTRLRQPVGQRKEDFAPAWY